MSVLALDNFDRANADPIGGNWTDDGDGDHFKIVSNAATYTNSGFDAAAHYNALTFPANHYSQVAVTVNVTSTGVGLGPSVRAATSKNYYRLVAGHAASSNVELAKKVAGTYTQLWVRTSSFTDGAIFYLEAIGTTLVARNGGVAIGASATDSSLASGQPGIVYSSVVTSGSVDNWEGGDFRVNMTTRKLQAVNRASTY